MFANFDDRFDVGEGGNADIIMDRENVSNIMKTKLENSVKDELVKRTKRNKLRAKLERLLIKKKNVYKKFIHKVRDKVNLERRSLGKRNMKKVREIKINRKRELKAELPAIINRYAECKIFENAGASTI